MNALRAPMRVQILLRQSGITEIHGDIEPIDPPQIREPSHGTGNVGLYRRRHLFDRKPHRSPDIWTNSRQIRKRQTASTFRWVAEGGLVVRHAIGFRLERVGTRSFYWTVSDQDAYDKRTNIRSDVIVLLAHIR